MLEEVEDINFFSHKLKRYLYIILFAIDIIFLISYITVDPIDKMITVIFAFGCNSLLGITILTINFSPQYNKDYRKIRDIGTKNKGYIIDTGFTCHGRISYKYFYITVLYNKKTIKVYRIKDNKQYKILKILLNSEDYPVTNYVKIPIDIYGYKDKIYADLESVDLSKLSGYEEAKKFIENIYK